MSSCFALKYGGYEIDSGKCYVFGEYTSLFTRGDRKISNNNERNTYVYEITIETLIERLNKIGFNESTFNLTLKEYIIEAENKYNYYKSQNWTNESFLKKEKKYIDFLKNQSINTIKKIFSKCLTYENPFYPTLSEHNLTQNELFLTEDLLNSGIWGPRYENPFNFLCTCWLLSNIFSNQDFFTIDYTDLVYAGYYEANEHPIDFGYDEIIASEIENSYIKGTIHSYEENLNTEFKEVNSTNPTNQIKKNFDKYIIGFLNSNGGKIIWGITNKREVVGVQLTYEQRDDLKREFFNSLDTIEPVISKNKIILNFIPIVHHGLVINDLFCIEVNVPVILNKTMYFSKSGKTWIRLDGITKELKGLELFNYIKDF